MSRLKWFLIAYNLTLRLEQSDTVKLLHSMYKFHLLLLRCYAYYTILL